MTRGLGKGLNSLIPEIYDEDIEIDDGVDIYKLVSEVFVSIDSSDELIKQIKIQVKESMEEWFKKRINELMHGL